MVNLLKQLGVALIVVGVVVGIVLYMRTGENVRAGEGTAEVGEQDDYDRQIGEFCEKGKYDGEVFVRIYSSIGNNEGAIGAERAKSLYSRVEGCAKEQMGRELRGEIKKRDCSDEAVYRIEGQIKNLYSNRRSDLDIREETKIVELYRETKKYCEERIGKIKIGKPTVSVLRDKVEYTSGYPSSEEAKRVLDRARGQLGEIRWFQEADKKVGTIRSEGGKRSYAEMLKGEVERVVGEATDAVETGEALRNNKRIVEELGWGGYEIKVDTEKGTTAIEKRE